MTPAELTDAIRAAVRAAVDDGRLAVEVPGDVVVERPKRKEFGDYATNVALQLAKAARRPPREVAEIIAGYLAGRAGIGSVEVAGPGFLNIRLQAGAQGELVRTIIEQGSRYGNGDTLRGQRINVEFVSANPTGPLHLGHTRWAAVGDALARVLAAAGAEVTREFYINDRGSQMDKFGESLAAAAAGEPIPDDGYHGDYIYELAKEIATDHPEFLTLPADQRRVAFREAGYERQLARQRRALENFRVHFDVWFSERTLHDSGAVDDAIETLRRQGHVFDHDGATWLRTTDFGDDRDRVLIRSNGEKTYFAADAAYYLDKRRRGFTRCIYLLGADHHGYVARLRAIAACAGDDPDQTLDILIGQLVKIVKDGAEVRLSKRAGEIVTLEDFVDLAGLDAVRYSLARYPADSPLVLDVDLITRQTNDNPVFYVQYVAARTASVSRHARELGIERGPFDPALLTHERESDLLGSLGEFPRVVATAAELREPHRIARYLEELAGVYHRFYDSCRILPVGDEPVTPLTHARLALNDATRIVIARGLDLLGVSAPERM
ncbi:MAG: arginine--tRNA ligase [Acidothermus sp.]|nr:arginine--tRNA ligase [Acidothermus sp.]MCL6537208.1 arginine--tRNA ligase [Acidothermus sp.]